ncbi:MAG: hypothetical protein HOE19_03305 [Candidatus Komeilibacteria bacterium]|jgi:hypothetical protein|nr:hypothetical protein [Candidatus Komeilibacteria bacterium]MBT4447704.1 hypothetical protein [Candidatus Komeilibacteria bacterium]
MSPEKNIEQQNINVEQVASVEKPIDASFDASKEQKIETQASEKPDNDQIAVVAALPDNDQTQSTPAQPITSEVIYSQVDNILSHDMDEVFLSLDAGTQRAFKIKGEETAIKITELLMKAKVKAKEITMLILEWLRIIPQVNKHYLEQEAKIKTDSILDINQEK